MITELDDGVGRVRAALKAAGMLQDTVIAFVSDNGGPFDHGTNAPLRGGKHTLWDGGVRVIAWVSSELIPKERRGTAWAGLMHASDWLPTFAGGVAGQPLSVATGPRPLDGHDMWPSWTTANTTSPRTEVIHQVVSKWNGPNCHNLTVNGSKLPPVCFTQPFGNTIRVGKYKLHQASVPGADQIVPWPEPAAAAVPFGLSGGMSEPGMDHLRAPGIKQNAFDYPPPGHGTHSHPCTPCCLFDLEADPSESHDLAADPKMAGVIASITARVEAAAATGGP